MTGTAKTDGPDKAAGDERPDYEDESPRRRRLSPEQRRSQLVDAAVFVLAARGYRHATAEVIAAQAGVSKGLLWRYFADLDDLMETTARRTLMTMAHAVGEQIDTDAPAAVVIRSAIHAAADLLHTHAAERTAISQIVPNLRNADGSTRLDFTDYAELWAAQEAAIFRRGQNEGHLKAGLDTHLIAVTYQGAVDTMLTYLEAHPATDAHTYADLVADILLTGITP